MADVNELLDAARGAYRQRAWDDAHAGFLAAGALGELGADDLSALADAAWWLGRVDESIETGTAAHRALLSAGRPRQAASVAVGIAVNHFLRGEEAPGSGWVARAGGLLADDPDCAEAGYLRYLLEVEWSPRWARPTRTP